MDRTCPAQPPHDQDYVIVSDNMGVLIDATDVGTLWTGNVAGCTDVRTFKHKDGESYIDQIIKEETAKAEFGDLRLVPAVADIVVNAAGQMQRCSREALAARLLIGSNDD